MLLPFVCGIAGISLGVALCLAFVIWQQWQQIRALNAERMLLWNKLLVRDGQQRLFSDRMVAGDIEHETPEPHPARTFKSPFRAGLDKLREKVSDESKPNLPPNIASSITDAAEKARSHSA